MNHFFQVLEKDLTAHPATSFLMILFAMVLKNAAILISVFSTAYSYTFSTLSIISVALVVLCHWRKGASEGKILYLKIKGVFGKLTIKEKIKKIFTKKGI